MPDPIKPIKKGEKATTKKAKKQEDKKVPSERLREMGGPNMSYSPNQMGHKDSAMKMESAKQEKYNLMHDMPVVKHGSWMSKHSKSAFQMGHEGSPAKHKLKDVTKGTHWHAEDGTIITEKEGKKHKQKLPTGPNVPTKKK